MKAIAILLTALFVVNAFAGEINVRTDKHLIEGLLSSNPDFTNLGRISSIDSVSFASEKQKVVYQVQFEGNCSTVVTVLTEGENRIVSDILTPMCM